MALVVICGQPCSGKSIAAVTLAETLGESETKQSVRIIDEASFHLDRNQNYANMPAEKNLRGKLRSDVERSVSRGDIVIVDSLNSIKGYRYELWCIAHAAGIRYCVVYCDVDEAHCRQWNKERSDRGEASYDDGIFEDLVRRFEIPERRNRWDSPLFELYPAREAIDKSSSVISEAVTYLTKTVDSRTQDVRILQPSIATQAARFSEANSLYELDRATQEIINAIVEQQSLGGAIIIHMKGVTKQCNFGQSNDPFFFLARLSYALASQLTCSVAYTRRETRLCFLLSAYLFISALAFLMFMASWLVSCFQ